MYGTEYINAYFMPKHFIALCVGLILLGAGCAPIPRPSAKQPLNVPEAVPVEKASEKTATNSYCTSPLASTISERPRLLPVKPEYQHLEVLGPIFTASECGVERLAEVLGNEDGRDSVDFVIVIKARGEYAQSEELRDVLRYAGFKCGRNLSNDGCWTLQAGTRASTLVTLKPQADKFIGDYREDTYTAFSEGVEYKYPVDPKSKLCTDEPVEAEIGSTIYPVASSYGKFGTYLGGLLTQYQCPLERFEKAQLAFGEGGFYTWGARLNLKAGPSAEFRRVLLDIGFVCAEGSSAPCTTWELKGTVPFLRLIHLEPFTDEVKSADCVNCG